MALRKLKISPLLTTNNVGVGFKPALKSLVLFFLLTQIIFSMELSIEGNFRGVFDNLENKFGPEHSGTIFGVHSDLSVGFEPNPNNSVFFGVNYFQQFGDERIRDFFPILSYRFLDERNHFVFGSLPRRNLINYHDYILSFQWQLKNPVFQGIFFEQNFENLNWSIWADWTGLQSRNTREEFIHGHNLTYTFNLNERNFLDLGWQFIYHHFASRDRDYYSDPVEDVGAFVGTISHRINEFSSPRLREIRSGVRGMFRYNRQRQFTNSYQSHAGMEIFAAVDLGRFDIGYSHYFVLHDKTHFPYDFVTGDDRFLTWFGQFDILIRFLQSEFANIDFRISFIPTEGGVNHRQTMNVNVPIRARVASR